MVQPFVSLESNLILCWHGFYEVNVTSRHQSQWKVHPLCMAEVDSTESADVRADYVEMGYRPVKTY